MSPPIIYFDLETTGLNYYHDRIIEVAAQSTHKERPFARLAHTEGQPLPEIITRLTGITDAALAKDGISEEQALRDFRAFIPRTRSPIYLVAHNNEGFDRWFLRSRMLHYGIRIPQNWRFLDTLQIARMLFPKRDRYNLESLCRDAGIRQIEAHRAGDDVRCLAEVTQHLLRFWLQRKGYAASTPLEEVIQEMWEETQMV